MKTHELLDRAADTIERLSAGSYERGILGHPNEDGKGLVTELRAEAEAYRRAWRDFEKAKSEAKAMETRP